MNPTKYVELVKKTESNNFEEIRERLLHIETIRLDHAADGLVTEAAEFKDNLKKYKFYGKTIDKVNLIEELGDILWYVAIACSQLKVPIEDIMTMNIAKLQKRYGISFNEEGAINRDLSAERYILEKDLTKVHFALSSDSSTICGKMRLSVDNITYNPKSITCEDCRRGMFVNYVEPTNKQ